MGLVQIPDTTFVRDTASMALINQDKNGLDAYIKQRNVLMTQKQEINKIKLDINDIRNDMQEIKSLMMQLIDKGYNG
jgi:hypothetical protein